MNLRVNLPMNPFRNPRIVRLIALLSVLLALSPMAPAQQAGTAPQAAASAAAADGLWLGTLQAGAQALRLQLHLKAGATGDAGCSLDSIDQQSFGMPCSAQVSGNAVSIDLPAISGKLSASLSADGKTLAGTWMQNGNSLPLTMEREATAIEPPKAAPGVFDPAMPPGLMAG